MAIIIEEEKRKINWFALLVTILILVVIGVLIYYLFFAPIPLIEKISPPSLQFLKEISSIELHPEAITGNPNFQILKQYINPIEIGTTTPMVNPFLPVH